MKNKIIIGLLSLTLGTCFFTSCNDDDTMIVTTPLLSDLTTGDATVTATTASITGSVKGLSQSDPSSYKVGVVYSTTQDPTAGGSSVAGSIDENGVVVTNLSGLNEGVTYYYATFVTLQNRVSQYGEVKSFITTDAAIATAAPAVVTSTSANLSGTLNGVQDKVENGTIEYGISIVPAGTDIAGKGLKIAGETTGNVFSVPAKALVPNTAYEYAAYMTINGAYVYGNTQQLTTAAGPRADLESPDDYVNMGTTLEWCKYNVGSESETEAGALIGYGDITGLARSTETSGYSQGDITDTPADVAAAAGMGKIPTASDWAELFAICDVAEQDGCLKLTSRATGNSILLPKGGTRMGDNVTDAGAMAAYWTGNADPTNSDYAFIMNGATKSTAMRSTGACVRPVRKPFRNEVDVDITKLSVGDLEGNGRIRIEIYNEYGATKDNPGINLSQISFDKKMLVQFTISGIKDNLKEGAQGSYRAGLQYAANGWYPSYWSAYDGNAQDCIVNGDGTYLVSMDAPAHTEGAVVFCVDINGLGADCVDKSLVKVTSLKVIFDPSVDYYNDVNLAAAHLWYGNKEDNGTDVRIEFYNEYGPSNVNGDPFAGVVFGQGTTVANVTLGGITGNLKEGVEPSFVGAMSLAAGGWWPSWWGGGASNVTVNGDGTYNFPAYLEANGTGTVVWCIDINGLWAAMADTSKLTVKVNNVITPAVVNN